MTDTPSNSKTLYHQHVQLDMMQYFMGHRSEARSDRFPILRKFLSLPVIHQDQLGQLNLNPIESELKIPMMSY